MAKSLQDILGKLLAGAPMIWEQLTKAGFKEDATEVELDFFYYGKDAKGAQKLKALLQEYEYTVEIGKSGGLFNRQIAVTGKTLPTTLNLEKIRQWIDWMATAGYEHGFEFDGWGCAVPGEA